MFLLYIFVILHLCLEMTFFASHLNCHYLDYASCMTIVPPLSCMTIVFQYYFFAMLQSLTIKHTCDLTVFVWHLNLGSNNEFAEDLGLSRHTVNIKSVCSSWKRVIFTLCERLYRCLRGNRHCERYLFLFTTKEPGLEPHFYRTMVLRLHCISMISLIFLGILHNYCQ